MKTKVLPITLGLCFAGLAQQASAAVVISFVPNSQHVGVGAYTSVELMISGLAGSTALGGYLIEFSYDAALVEVTGVSFPVRPTWTTISRTRVVACWAGYFRATAHRGAFDVAPARSRSAISSTFTTTPSIS